MPNSTKSMLLLQACDGNGIQSLIDNVIIQARLYNIECASPTKISTTKELKDSLAGNEYDYVYLLTHGSKECFGDNCNFNISWIEFAHEVCVNACIKEGGVFFLSCCKGGLHQVAHTLFSTCPNSEYVCGPRANLTVPELLVAFGIFVYNLEFRKLDPVVAAKKIECATDLRFICFDRDETESSTEYYIHIGQEAQHKALADCPTCE